MCGCKKTQDAFCCTRTRIPCFKAASRSISWKKSEREWWTYPTWWPSKLHKRQKIITHSSIIFKFDSKLAAIILSLRDRMRFYKLRVTPNATKIASTFNEQFKPEKIPEHNDYQTEWIDSSCPDEILIGEKVCLQESHSRLAAWTQHKS